MFVAKHKVGTAKEVSAWLIIDAILQKRGCKLLYKNKIYERGSRSAWIMIQRHLQENEKKNNNTHFLSIKLISFEELLFSTHLPLMQYARLEINFLTGSSMKTVQN